MLAGHGLAEEVHRKCQVLTAETLNRACRFAAITTGDKALCHRGCADARGGLEHKARRQVGTKKVDELGAAGRQLHIGAHQVLRQVAGHRLRSFERRKSINKAKQLDL